MTIELGLLPATATPVDYHRLKFDPSNVPAKRIVGLLACQRDPLLRSFTTRLYAARPAAIAAVPTQKGKGQKKKDKSAAASGASTPLPPSGLPSGAQTPVSEVAEGMLWEVELEDTIVFPEGGGQPSDTGTLTFTDPNGTPHVFRVEMCIRKKLDSIHLVRVPPTEEAFFEGLQVGDEVKVDVDWERRLDQMTIHTAQHLLSAILDTFSPTSPALNTLSWAMHAHPSLEHPYVELPRQLTWAECEEVERRCNQAIDEARRIWIEVSVQGGQGGDAGVGTNAGGADDERESRGLPKDYAGGVIRHCCIHGTDRNACCGTQLPHLGLIQQLHVIPPTLSSTSSSPSGSATKLFFTAGPRARRSLAAASKNLSLAAQALGCNRDLVPERAQKSEEGRKEAVGTGEGLRKELARLVGQVAWASALSAGVNAEQSAKEGADGSEEEKEKEEGDDRGPVIWVDRTEKGTHDFDFLGQVATAVQVQADASTSDGPKTDTEPLIICLSAVDTSPIAGGLLLIQSKSDALAKETKDRLAAELNAIPLSSRSETPVSTGSKAANAAAGSANGSAGAKTKVQTRVKGGGAKGRYMCKIDGKIGKREREALRGVVESLRRGE